MRRFLAIINPLNSTAGFALPHAFVILALLFGAYAAGAFTEKAVLANHGGYTPAPLPPNSRIEGGPVPSAHSLLKYLVRIHNQGTSNSCVSQTGSTIEEIVQAERGDRKAFSAGFLYNQTNGGVDAGTSYNAMFDILVSEGDAPLSAFGADGLDTDYYWTVPEEAIQAAAPYRFSSWITVAPSDQYSIEYAVAHGIPVAFAIPVYSSFYNLFSVGYMPYLTGQGGTYEFAHSMTIYAYDPSGVDILNSWGPNWGLNGRAHLSWGFLAQYATVAIATPPAFHVVPAPKPPKFTKKQATIWNFYRISHHKKLIPFQGRSSLTQAAKYWLKHGPSRTGGIVKKEHWTPKPHRGGYETDYFRKYRLLFWVHHPQWGPKWVKHRLVR